MTECGGRKNVPKSRGESRLDNEEERDRWLQGSEGRM